MPLSASDRLLTAQQVADMLGINVRTLREWRHAGKFPKPTTLGRSPRWRRRDVDAWLAKARRA